jgi:hypothetical protein
MLVVLEARILASRAEARQRLGVRIWKLGMGQRGCALLRASSVLCIGEP